MSYYLNECETMQCQLVYMIQPFERDNCLEVSLIILIVSERILSRCGTRCVPKPIIFLGGKAAAYHTNQQHKFLHRLHMTYFDPVPFSELLDRIDASKYHEKTKKKMRRIAKKANGCVSLAAVRKDCRIKKSDFIKLLGKFEEMGVGCVSC